MKSKFTTILTISALLLVGCFSNETLESPTPASPTVEQMLNDADNYAKAKRWQQAFVAYSDALNSIDDYQLHQEVKLKVVESLYELQDYPAALAGLAPMPELPATLLDCKKLAMASRILHKMKSKPEYVEALLEVALDNTVQGDGVILFKAQGYAELGKIYVSNGKTAKASKCFEYASELYEMEGNTAQADACKNIMEYLK